MSFKECTLERYSKVAKVLGVNIIGTLNGKLKIEFACGHQRDIFPAQLMQNAESLTKCRECQLQKKLETLKSSVNCLLT